MRVLAVCCHPSADSFHASVRAEVLASLTAAGCEVTVVDLYAEGFDPVLGAAEWGDQWTKSTKSPEVERHIAELRSAQALLLIYPTWWYGLPAMLKGWLDRVWIPGVAFDINNGKMALHMLSNIRRFAVVTTHGSPWWAIALAMGAPGRKQVVRGLTQHLARGCKVSWNAAYGVDVASPATLGDWRAKTARRLARFLTH